MMGDFNYRIEAENKVVDQDTGVVLMTSFWRDHCFHYIGMREAGATHAQTASNMRKKYGQGGGPRPRFYHEDEIELTSMNRVGVGPKPEFTDEELIALWQWGSGFSSNNDTRYYALRKIEAYFNPELDTPDAAV